MEFIATRTSYGNALCELAEEIDNIAVLDADLSAATMTSLFAKKHPDKFYNCGIAEQNMLGVAAGLAASGKLVFASSFAMFAAGRAFEIIRNSVAYPNLNVKICATHAGIATGEDGATHQCIEDIAIMRAIPNMTVINPADDTEAYAAVLAMKDYPKPVYMRLGRLAVPVVFDRATYKFELGKGIVMRRTDKDAVTIIASGLTVDRAATATEILAAKGISARLVNIHTIKPLDTDLIIDCAKETGKIIVVEEHTEIGGLGSAVCDALAEHYPTPVKKIAVPDRFGFSGAALDLLDLFGFSPENIAKVTEEFISQHTSK
ncbi:MAG: transketolase family protein [Oscillospiraceae bacterium]|jgi:transketolase|nr:transketolase family protein [Oscillospiraceae bacterium]